jgi:hypothetical protein
MLNRCYSLPSTEFAAKLAMSAVFDSGLQKIAKEAQDVASEDAQICSDVMEEARDQAMREQDSR